MPMNRQKAKGRRESGPFVPLPCSVLNNKNFITLSYKANKLIMDMASQLRFSSSGPTNNGDISIAWSVMQKRGWKSKETLQNAANELQHFGFIKLTRQGGRHKCSLFALTWWAINDCGGKLECRETRVPSNEWKQDRDSFKPKTRM